MWCMIFNKKTWELLQLSDEARSHCSSRVSEHCWSGEIFSNMKSVSFKLFCYCCEDIDKKKSNLDLTIAAELERTRNSAWFWEILFLTNQEQQTILLLS